MNPNWRHLIALRGFILHGPAPCSSSSGCAFDTQTAQTRDAQHSGRPEQSAVRYVGLFGLSDTQQACTCINNLPVRIRALEETRQPHHAVQKPFLSKR